MGGLGSADIPPTVGVQDIEFVMVTSKLRANNVNCLYRGYIFGTISQFVGVLAPT